VEKEENICAPPSMNPMSRHCIRLAFSFRVGLSTASKIVKNVYQEIYYVLQPNYLPKPTTQTCIDAVDNFSELWEFSNCLRSIGSDTSYFFFIVLLAVVDPYYKFMVVDIGSYG